VRKLEKKGGKTKGCLIIFMDQNAPMKGTNRASRMEMARGYITLVE